MSNNLDFYFDFSSSHTYIGRRRIQEQAARHHLALRRLPISLGAVFRERGHAAQMDEAMGRGVFGAPTLFAGEEMFWGADRLYQLDSLLKGKR
jgi:2-hydroxychromene-2-carboxylate isomerase